MRNEELLAKERHEYSQLSGTQREYHSYGYMEGVTTPTEFIFDEKAVRDAVFERLVDMNNEGEITCEDIENHKEIDFDLNTDEVAVHFSGAISDNETKDRPFFGCVEYNYKVSGKIAVYKNAVWMATIPFEDTLYFEEIHNEMAYYGCKESDF